LKPDEIFDEPDATARIAGANAHRDGEWNRSSMRHLVDADAEHAERGLGPAAR
jgi:hypothetical protein